LPARTRADCLVLAAAGLLLLALAGAAAPARAAGLHYRVELEAPADLTKVLKSGLNLVRWQDDPQMTEDQLKRLVDDALRETREAAATEGYFSAQVEARIDRGVEPWVVHLRLEPGPRTRVGDVEIHFTGPALDDYAAQAVFKRVREGWALRRGEPFRQADWEAAKRGALRELSGWRYAAAQIADSRAVIDAASRLAHLRIELDSGIPYRFGELHVSGTKRHPDATVENMAPFRAGDTYERDRLQQYQRRLLETGYFASVQAEIDNAPATAQAAPVRIAVIEAAKHHVETGVGYTTDGGANVEFSYSNQDVAERSWRFRSALRADQKTQQLDLDLDSPPQPGAHWNNFFGRARHTDIEGQETREFAVGIAHNFGFERTPSALILSAHADEQRVDGFPDNDTHAIYAGHRRTFRRTDDVVSPRRGYFGSLEIGGGLPGVSSREFLRGTASGSLLIPYGRSSDFTLRAQAGAVLSNAREGIPAVFLFRTGGDQTVRGYAFDSLGVQQGAAVVGGRRVAVGSVEYTRWIGEGWGLATFVDAGDAWDNGVRFNPAFGYGVGVRVRSPIGPIRADVAYGERVSGFRLHFSVGFNF
jgi:translocation and assembly module TamA